MSVALKQGAKSVVAGDTDTHVKIPALRNFNWNKTKSQLTLSREYKKMMILS